MNGQQENRYTLKSLLEQYEYTSHNYNAIMRKGV